MMARRDVDACTPNYEVITRYCPYCNRSGAKVTKYGPQGPIVIFNRRERVALVADEPRHRRISISEYGGERIPVPFVCTDAK